MGGGKPLGGVSFPDGVACAPFAVVGRSRAQNLFLPACFGRVPVHGFADNGHAKGVLAFVVLVRAVEAFGHQSGAEGETFHFGG